MPRHEKPKILIDYENMKRPKICHTCESYDISGICLKHMAEPPKDFAETDKACPDHEEDAPF